MLKWLITVILDWALGKIGAFIGKLIKKKKLEDELASENKKQVDELKNATTEEERRSSTSNIVGSSF